MRGQKLAEEFGKAASAGGTVSTINGEIIARCQCSDQEVALMITSILPWMKYQSGFDLNNILYGSFWCLVLSIQNKSWV